MNSNALTFGNLSFGQTMARLASGAGMILYAMLHTGPFAEVALLPLLAVYPIITGLIGVDPFYLLWQKYTGRGADEEFCLTARILLTATAAALIGSVMAVEGPMGMFGILALVAVYPALAAMIGRDPFNAFYRPQRVAEIVELKTREKETAEHPQAA